MRKEYTYPRKGQEGHRVQAEKARIHSWYFRDGVKALS